MAERFSTEAVDAGGIPSANRPETGALVVRSAGRMYALPLSSVIETMRILPVQPIPGAPQAVLGVSVIRGVLTPVVGLAEVFGEQAGTSAARMVTVRAGQRPLAVAVEAVMGVSLISGWDRLPGLLRDACGARVQAIAALDAEFLWVLEASRLVSEPVWDALSCLEKHAD